MPPTSHVRQAIRYYDAEDPSRLLRALIDHSGWIVASSVMVEHFGVNYAQVIFGKFGEKNFMPPGPLCVYTDLEAAETAYRAAALRREYRDALERWKALPFWQRLRTRRPEPPAGAVGAAGVEAKAKTQQPPGAASPRRQTGA
jgi:hypothetical protein